MRELKRVDWLAKLLSVTPSRAYQLLHEQKIPHFRIGKSIFLDEATVTAWFDEHAVISLNSDVTGTQTDR